MTSKATTRSFQFLTKRARPSCQCINSTSQSSSIRQISATSSRRDVEWETEKGDRPRWAHTPERMKAPYSIVIKDPARIWKTNTDPAKLDRFYTNFLGRGGDAVLTDEVKWLAVTHKSFDQGRRGFNDRLAFFGRRILNLQATLTLLHSETATRTQYLSDINPSGAFKHPALEGLANLSNLPVTGILGKARVAQLATQTGLREVLRWKPRIPGNLESSGVEAVLTTTMFAIIGAIALQKGTATANEVARERILKPLGIS